MGTIKLSSGETIEYTHTNGDYFVSLTEYSKDFFTGKTNPLIIDDILYEDMYCFDIMTEEVDGEKKYLYCFKRLDESELRSEEGVSYLASILLTDDQAYHARYLFPDWNPNGVRYTKDISKVQYNGELWKCLDTHDSQLSWNPEDADSLWVRIDNPAEEWPEWRQPTGSTDAYSKDDKVSHDGKHWISNVDGMNTNTWEPGVFGWDEQPSDE